MATSTRDMRMATVILFHSAYGLRPLERDAAERLAAAGHQVVTPDLYDGRVAGSIGEAVALRDGIGWRTLFERAERAVADLPATAVLGGFSMGAAVAATLWAKRPKTAGLLFLHSIAELPANARTGVPLQLHLADPDPFEPAEEVAAWRAAAAETPIALEIFTYPGAGHIYTDPTLADHDAVAARLTWDRVERFLARL
ncbi:MULTISPECIES: dienelactone hydrolase family protein [Sinorhizobium]|nr:MULTISPECIES: dienelactone hydrolase family protein [Sinorhizobium]